MRSIEEKECMRDFILPIFLGRTARSRALSSMLFKKLGVVSLMCDKKQSFFDGFSLCTRFCPIATGAHSRLVFEQLLALSEKYSNHVGVLVPCTEEFSSVIDEYRGELEARFIISMPTTLLESGPVADMMD